MAVSVNASITTKGDRYYLVVSYSRDGKRNQKWIKTDYSVSGNNKRKVEQLRLQTINEWQDKVSLSDNDMLFSEFLKIWLEDIKHTISKNTYFSYRQIVLNSICPYFEEKKIKLCDLKPYHIQDFYKKKLDDDHVSANTIHHYHANIHKALAYAVKTERLLRNPADKVELPKKQKHIANFYSADELRTLLEAAKGTQLEPIVMFAAWFGLRRGEILGIKWECIDFETQTLHIVGTVKDKGESGSKIKNLYYEPAAKTSASIRSFPMSSSAVNYLFSLKAEQDERKKRPGYNHQWDDFVCVRNNGDLIPLEYVSRYFPKLCEKAGLRRLKLHELRHTNISLLLESGASMKELQEWAGHSSYSTTANIYSHVQAKTKSKMTESLEKIIC